MNRPPSSRNHVSQWATHILSELYTTTSSNFNIVRGCCTIAQPMAPVAPVAHASVSVGVQTSSPSDSDSESDFESGYRDRDIAVLLFNLNLKLKSPWQLLPSRGSGYVRVSLNLNHDAHECLLLQYILLHTLEHGTQLY